MTALDPAGLEAAARALMAATEHWGNDATEDSVPLWSCPVCRFVTAEPEAHEGYCDGTVHMPHERAEWVMDVFVPVAKAIPEGSWAEQKPWVWARFRRMSCEGVAAYLAVADPAGAERERIVKLLREGDAEKTGVPEVEDVLVAAATWLNSGWHGPEHPCSSEPCTECREDALRVLCAAADLIEREGSRG